MKTPVIKFLNFLESIKTLENTTLIESLEKAFKVILENDDINEMRTEDKFNLMSDLEEAQNVFSDTYKELNGFRPRTMTNEQWNSVEWLQTGIDDMRKQMNTPEYLAKLKEDEQYYAQRDAEAAQDREI